MIRRLLAHVTDYLTPAPLDMGLPEPTTVRDCRADAPLTDRQRAEIESLLWDMDMPRPHEETAAERIGGGR